MAKNKHLTDLERMLIEQKLREGVSLKQIAAILGKSASTISCEVRARAIESNKYAPYRIHNRCAKLNVCQKYSSVRINPTAPESVPAVIIAMLYARNSRNGCASNFMTLPMSATAVWKSASAYCGKNIISIKRPTRHIVKCW